MIAQGENMERDKVSNFAVMILGAFCFCFLGACTTADKEQAITPVAKLTVSFVDSIWDGNRIPAGQQCKAYGGNGATPRLLIKDIPSEANVLIMEYSDKTWPPMDNGGHGVIGFRLNRKTKVITITSIPEAAKNLPEGFFLVPPMDTPYVPPCSGGSGNLYYVTIKAVYEATQGKEAKLLAKAVLNLGVY